MHRAGLVLRCLAAAAWISCGCTTLADVDAWPTAAGAGGAGSATSNGASSGSIGGGGIARACGGPTPTDAYSSVVLEDAPRGYWRLNETYGLLAKDEMGCHDGTYTGSVVLGEPGAVGSGVALSGVDSRVVIGDVLDFEGAAEFSLEAWVLPNKVDDTYRRIIDKGTVGPRNGYFLQVQNNVLMFERWRDDASDVANHTEFAVTTEYRHIVGTHDGRTLRLYLDGQQVADGTSEEALTDLEVDLVLGSNEAASNTFWGLLDEVAIYDHALDADRVSAHYAAGSSR